MTSTSYLPITIVPTKTFQDFTNTIHLSNSLINYWGIKPSESIQLCIGTKLLTVNIDTKALEKDHILLSEKLMTALSLPPKEVRFMSQYDKKTKTLYLGPVFAVMTEISERNGEPSFRSIHSFCEELHYVTETLGGFFYVFHVKDFSLDSIDGYYYEQENWIKEKLIPPSIIYNRVHSRKIENSPFFNKVTNQIILEQIPLFNERFLSKWEVHNILYAEEHLHPFLPETELFSEGDFTAFLNKYKAIFLKPINGSQGRNIFRVSERQNKILVDLSSTNHSDKTREFYHVEDFLKWFQKRRKQTTFIMQQPIPLCTFQDRQLDFRVLCHKNYQDNWRVTSVVSRISAQEQFVSNLARGGEMMRPAIPLSKLFDQKTALSQVKLMKELSLEVANVISQFSKGYVGELGIDIGVDYNGRLWIIEVNSKPSKNAEEQKSNVRPSAKAIFEYGTALAFQYLRIQ